MDNSEILVDVKDLQTYFYTKRDCKGCRWDELTIHKGEVLWSCRKAGVENLLLLFL